jgi:hypothetical protein
MKYIAALIFALVATAALAATDADKLSDPALEARARSLQKELRCLVCQGESLDESNAELARDLRRIIRERIAAGESPIRRSRIFSSPAMATSSSCVPRSSQTPIFSGLGQSSCSWWVGAPSP